jgi:hypothetical protein
MSDLTSTNDTSGHFYAVCTKNPECWVKRSDDDMTLFEPTGEALLKIQRECYMLFFENVNSSN